MKSPLPTRELQQHTLQKEGPLTVQQMKQPSEIRWVQMASEWTFKGIFQFGMYRVCLTPKVSPPAQAQAWLQKKTQSRRNHGQHCRHSESLSWVKLLLNTQKLQELEKLQLTCSLHTLNSCILLPSAATETSATAMVTVKGCVLIFELPFGQRYQTQESRQPSVPFCSALNNCTT